MNSKYFVILLLLPTILIQLATSFLSIIFGIIRVINTITYVISTAKNIKRLSKHHSLMEATYLAMSDKKHITEIINEVRNISAKLETIEKTFTIGITDIIVLLKELPLQNLDFNVNDEIIDCYDAIDRFHTTAVIFRDNVHEKHSQSSLPHIIDSLTGFKQNQLYGQINELRAIIAPFSGIMMRSYPSILAMQLHALESRHCGPQSLQLSSLELFARIIHVEYKALDAGIIGYQLLSTHYDVDTTASIDKLKDDATDAYIKYHEVFATALRNMSTEIRACDGNTTVDDMAGTYPYLQLGNLQSDVKNNKVITGLKFIKYGYVIKLAITEGELSEYGEIIDSVEEWTVEYQYGPDVNVIPLNGNTIINFDNIKLPKNYVMTGIHLQVSKKSETHEHDHHVELRIDGTSFDFASGKLSLEQTKSYESSISHMTELPHSHFKDPHNLKCDKPLEPNSGIDEYVRFDQYDHPAARGYISPLFDNEEVILTPKVALSGAGIFMKTSEDCEGLIGLRVFTADFADYFDDVKDELPEESVI